MALLLYHKVLSCCWFVCYLWKWILNIMWFKISCTAVTCVLKYETDSRIQETPVSVHIISAG